MRGVRGYPLAPGTAGDGSAAFAGGGAFDGHTAEHRRTIPGPGLHGHLAFDRSGAGANCVSYALEPTADRARHQTVLDTMTPVSGCQRRRAGIHRHARARFWQDGWHPTQWGGCCDGVNRTILEVFVTDSQQALATCERDVPGASVLLQRDRWKG